MASFRGICLLVSVLILLRWFKLAHIYFTMAVSRVVESAVKYPAPTLPKFPTLTPAFLKFPTPDSNSLTSKGNEIWLLKSMEMWFTARNLCFSKSFKRNCTISTGIPNSRVWFKKWSNWTSRVGQKNPTLTPSVVRNPTPPKNLRLVMTPTPQPWL